MEGAGSGAPRNRLHLLELPRLPRAVRTRAPIPDHRKLNRGSWPPLFPSRWGGDKHSIKSWPRWASEACQAGPVEARRFGYKCGFSLSNGGGARQIPRSLPRKAGKSSLTTGRCMILDSLFARTALTAVAPQRQLTAYWGAWGFSLPDMPGLANGAESLFTIKNANFKLYCDRRVSRLRRESLRGASFLSPERSKVARNKRGQTRLAAVLILAPKGLFPFSVGEKGQRKPRCVLSVSRNVGAFRKVQPNLGAPFRRSCRYDLPWNLSPFDISFSSEVANFGGSGNVSCRKHPRLPRGSWTSTCVLLAPVSSAGRYGLSPPSCSFSPAPQGPPPKLAEGSPGSSKSAEFKREAR